MTVQEGFLNPQKTSMKGRRLDWLVHTLTTCVAGYYLHKQLEKRSGFKRNLEFEKKVKESVHRAGFILNSHVRLPSEQGGWRLCAALPTPAPPTQSQTRGLLQCAAPAHTLSAAISASMLSRHVQIQLSVLTTCPDPASLSHQENRL